MEKIEKEVTLTVEELKKAFSCKALKGVYEKLLRIQYEMPEHKVTMSILAQKMGWKTHQPANRWYGGLADVITKECGYTYGYTDDGNTWELFAFNDIYRPTQAGEQWTFVLTKEAVQALKELGW